MNEIITEFEKKLNAITRVFHETLSGIRSGRPSAKLVEDIRVEYFGESLPVKQIASISVQPPREILISSWDKSAVAGITKAIEAANLNVGISSEGAAVRISLPQLSSERRQELGRLVRKEAEESRIRIREARDEAIKTGKQKEESGEITEDEKYKLKDEIQEHVDKTNAELEKMVENKIKEIEE